MKIDTDKAPVSNNMNAQNLPVRKKNQNTEGKEREIKLRQTSKDLESIFITQMFKAMEKTIPKSTLSGSKNNLSSMLFSSAMGKAVANQGGVGLADVIYKSLLDKEVIPSLEEIKNNSIVDDVQTLRFSTDLDGE